MALNTLKDLFVNRLHDIFDAEKQVAQIMPSMAQTAGSIDLKRVFESESESANDQISRLDQIFENLGIAHDSITSEGMRGIVQEGRALMEEAGDPAVKDAALISIAQEMKHYEMAAYGSVRTWAREMDYPDIANTLQNALDEEGDTDKKLSKLAEGGLFAKGINKMAPK